MDGLAKLIAIEDIKQLKARYCRLIDTRDFDALGQVFSKDAVFDRGEAGPAAGREVITKWIREAYGNLKSVHHAHCHEVTIDSETDAHGIVAVEDFARSLDGRTKLAHGAGHYHEKYRFEDGAWRISHVKLTRLFLDWEKTVPKD